MSAHFLLSYSLYGRNVTLATSYIFSGIFIIISDLNLMCPNSEG